MRWVILLGLLVLPIGEVGATCRSDQRLDTIGNATTATGVIDAAANEVRLIVASCGASACEVALYDTTTVAATSDANLVWEGKGAANAQITFPDDGFLEQPLTFTSGVVLVDDGNLNVLTVHECVDR